jgi:cell division inhibitor SepF
VINVERLNKTDVIRVCDFISGATYALAGKMKEISENVLVIAPSNVDIQTSEIDSKTSYEDEDDEYEY